MTGVFPAVTGKAKVCLDKFAGGGFAGQVYRCRLESLELPEGTEIPGLEIGRFFSLKLLVPPSRSRCAFRNFMFWLAYQGPFSAQVNEDACRAGAALRLLIRRGAQVVFGRDDAVSNIYATFFDSGLNAFGDISEWVEGRNWQIEQDLQPQLRRNWRTVQPEATGSPEYVAKRQFMAKLVELFHDMGAAELARQYEWWSMKSQPNVLKRLDAGPAPAAGLCAIDFRAGLALIFGLPMSPVDFKLILAGLFRRGALVQFDRIDVPKLERFIAEHAGEFTDLQPLIDEFKTRNAKARQSLPDITRQGWRLLISPELRRSVRAGLVQGYQAARQADAEFAEKLRGSTWRFFLFYLLGILPILGGKLRKLWGNRVYRQHCGRLLCSFSYLRKVMNAKVAYRLVEWHRRGRTGETRTRFLLRHPLNFLLQRFTLGFLPVKLHRWIAEPSYAWNRTKVYLGFLWTFYRDAEFREQWLLSEIEQGESEGMLSHEQAEHIRQRCKDPFIVKYLQGVAVHFATIPVTRIVGGIVAAIAMAVVWNRTRSWEQATLTFGGVFIIFQFFLPVSPGSLCRGLYVVYLMIRERNLRDYVVAAPLAFAKGIGYLAFPLQAATVFPDFSQFMAGRWATRSTRLIPVFGEHGALLEHMVFDIFFNRTLMLFRWAAPRLPYILDAWLLFGSALWMWLYAWLQPNFWSGKGFELTLSIVIIFILPRVLFYPLSAGRRKNELAAGKL